MWQSLLGLAFIVPPPMIDPPLNGLAEAAHTPLGTGVACYLAGLATLSIWEEVVVPALKLRSILPDVPSVTGQLTERQRNARWITPLTADQRLPLPSLDRLRDRDHRVGSQEGVSQHITVCRLRHVRGLQERSDEWSRFYGTDICVYKGSRRESTSNPTP